jgi:hypothetical protein
MEEQNKAERCLGRKMKGHRMTTDFTEGNEGNEGRQALHRRKQRKRRGTQIEDPPSSKTLRRASEDENEENWFP